MCSAKLIYHSHVLGLGSLVLSKPAGWVELNHTHAQITSLTVAKSDHSLCPNQTTHCGQIRPLNVAKSYHSLAKSDHSLWPTHCGQIRPLTFSKSYHSLAKSHHSLWPNQTTHKVARSDHILMQALFHSKVVWKPNNKEYEVVLVCCIHRTEFVFRCGLIWLCLRLAQPVAVDKNVLMGNINKLRLVVLERSHTACDETEQRATIYIVVKAADLWNTLALPSKIAPHTLDKEGGHRRGTRDVFACTYNWRRGITPQVEGGRRLTSQIEGVGRFIP